MSKKGAAWTRSSISGALEPIHGHSGSISGGGPLSPQLFSRRFSKAQPFVIQEDNAYRKQEHISSPTRSIHHAKTLSSIPGITATSNLIGLGLYRSPKSTTGLTIKSSKRSKRILSGLLLILVFVVWMYGGASSSSSPNDTPSKSTFSYLPKSPSAKANSNNKPLLARLFSSKSSTSNKARREAEEREREQLAASPSGGHTFHPNGLLLVNPKGRHPINVLIEHGEKKWNDLLKRQSKTLDEATQEYKRRYKRNPPKGWEQW